MQRKLIDNKGKTVVVVYDEYFVVDTVDYDGKRIASTHRVARKVLANADDIFNGMAPKSWRWDKGRG